MHVTVCPCAYMSVFVCTYVCWCVPRTFVWVIPRYRFVVYDIHVSYYNPGSAEGGPISFYSMLGLAQPG